VRKFGGAADAEGLRLMKAFFHITEPDRRREVIALAEKLAEQAGRSTLALQLPQDNEPAT
jgi:hypothetical protein